MVSGTRGMWTLAVFSHGESVPSSLRWAAWGATLGCGQPASRREMSGNEVFCQDIYLERHTDLPDQVAKRGICRDDVVTLPNRRYRKQHEVTAI
jgi:hypothetical protein